MTKNRTEYPQMSLVKPYFLSANPNPPLTMRDDQQPLVKRKGKGEDLTKTPSSRKRFLADPQPKQGSAAAAASSDSALSSDSSSDRFRKKTRDLPNFSDCHCCGLRINTTNPKDKLQTLDSFWRIVLLCKKCINRVDSAELCSYCFSEIQEEDCFRCRDCERCVHRDCVLKYRCSAPWSYCFSELGFSVCVDCWVPKLLANSNRVFKKIKKSNVKSCPVANSRVLDVVNDAKSVVERKGLVAAKAKENALRKAVVARRAAKLGNGALELDAKKDENGAKNECSVMSSSASDSTTMAVDDADLAFQLHRVMNSSPRISKNFGLINSGCLTVPRIRDCNDSSSNGLSGSKGSSNHSVCRKIEVWTNMASDCGSHVGLDNLKDGMVYTRRCRKDKECREIDGQIVGKCNPGDDNSLISESKSCWKQDELECELHPDDARNHSRMVCDGNATGHDGRCNGKLDRYMLKYSKRPVGSKAISNSETKILDDGAYVESKDTAAGPLNCSEECRTFSDASFQSKTVSLQPSACASGLDNLKQDGMVYTRRCKKDKECHENDGQIVGNGNHCDYSTLISESQSCHKQDELEYELHLDDTRNQSQYGNTAMLHDGRCNGNLDRYMFKYSKRPVILKAISNSDTKILGDGSYVESKATAVGPLNFSEECRTFSDSSFQSCTVSLQASACESGSSRDPSASIMVDDVKFNKYVEAMVDIHQIHASVTMRDRRANVEFT
ncbi:unnamed protein product [Camellia sinensis]